MSGLEGFSPELFEFCAKDDSKSWWDAHRSSLLRWKGAVVVKEYERARRMESRDALDRVRRVRRGFDPLRTWIDEHVARAR